MKTNSKLKTVLERYPRCKYGVIAGLFVAAAYLSFSPNVSQARWYDPERGKFVSRDPFLDRIPDKMKYPKNNAEMLASTDGPNPYEYSRSNPSNRIDISGGCSSEPPPTPPTEIIVPSNDPLSCYTNLIVPGGSNKWERIPELNSESDCMVWAVSHFPSVADNIKAGICVICNRDRGKIPLPPECPVQ